RIKQWIKVNRIDAQISEVIEFINDAFQVSAVAAVEHPILVKVVAEFFFPLIPRIPITGPRRNTPGGPRINRCLEGFARRIVFRITVAESLRENLIKYRLSWPAGTSAALRRAQS